MRLDVSVEKNDRNSSRWLAHMVRRPIETTKKGGSNARCSCLKGWEKKPVNWALSIMF